MSERVPEPTDEELMAFVDGELDPARAADVDALARRVPDVAARIRSFGRADAALQATFPRQSPSQAMPPGLEAAAARLAEALAARHATFDNVVPIGAAQRARPRRRWRDAALPGAIAASLILGIAVMLMRDASDPAAIDLLALERRQQLDATHPLHGVLERSPSSLPVELGGDGGASTRARVWLSFRTADARLCREFEVDRGPLATVAVACRVGEAWQVEAAGRAGAVQGGADGSYVTAGSPQLAAITRAVDELMAGDALSTGEEAALIARGWR